MIIWTSRIGGVGLRTLGHIAEKLTPMGFVRGVSECMQS